VNHKEDQPTDEAPGVKNDETGHEGPTEMNVEQAEEKKVAREDEQWKQFSRQQSFEPQLQGKDEENALIKSESGLEQADAAVKQEPDQKSDALSRFYAELGQDNNQNVVTKGIHKSRSALVLPCSP